jgi:hypothetical protein
MRAAAGESRYALSDIATNEAARTARDEMMTFLEPRLLFSLPPAVTPIAAETPHMNSTRLA